MAERRTQMSIVSRNNRVYDVGKRIGSGGVATVYHATEKANGAKFAFKSFKPDPTVRGLRAKHLAIRNNILNLIEKPILDQDGKPLSYFVNPIDVFDVLPHGGFGYVMPLVDLNQYTTIPKSWTAKTRPDAKAICEIGKRVASFFQCVHKRGYCYKDVNEGNIYFNPRTGDVRVIDCDNIGVSELKTIFGTPGYIAPEVYKTGMPNAISDRFSMATFFYRLIVGGYPLDGQKTALYLIQNDIDEITAAPKIFGTEALFVFDELDKSNTIRNVKSSKISDIDKKRWSNQVTLWDRAPKILKDYFIRTFSTYLKGDNIDPRTTDKQWYDAFDEVSKNGLVKCSCGRYNFAGNSTCEFCDKRLNSGLVIGKTKKAEKAENQGTNQRVEQPKKRIILEERLPSKIEFIIRSSKVGNNQDLLKKAEKELTLGKRLSNDDGSILTFEYDKVRGVMRGKNVSSYIWEVQLANGNTYKCPRGATIILQKNMVIKLDSDLKIRVDKII